MCTVILVRRTRLVKMTGVESTANHKAVQCFISECKAHLRMKVHCNFGLYNNEDGKREVDSSKSCEDSYF
jgi:hypothetical protein